MLSLDDSKWKFLCGGYRRPYNPCAALQRLRAGEKQGPIWNEFWDELHHQGDVGEASYAAVPHLVGIQKDRGDLNWNVYARLATIEIERHRHLNPPIPDWLRPDYEIAWKELLAVALRDYATADDQLLARAILAALALCKGLATIGTVLAYFDESEIKDFYRDHVNP